MPESATGTGRSSRSSAPTRGGLADRSKAGPCSCVHTKGAKTGQERINPLAYLRDGDRYVVFASRAGRRRTRIGSTTSSRTPM